jgi:N-acetylglucosaminyldiphosphoundecaprenol N-acetyl-beta-D-mannosaminyltransferase
MSESDLPTTQVLWPSKYDLWGVRVSATDYDDLLDRVLQAARWNVQATVDHMPVHGLVEAVGDASLRHVLNAFSVLAPDGQPVRWALNVLHDLALRDRVYGPEFMKRLCGAAAHQGHGVYLYGGSAQTVVKLRARLQEMFPGLSIAGWESPPYRELTPEEDREAINRINGSGARIVFLGLGCPKQEIFAYQHRDSIRGVQVCVGAAFDFLSGEKRMAPRWMQDRGLEWLFRLSTEPRRLHKRYLRTNSLFIWLVTRELWRRKKPGTPKSTRGTGGSEPRV